MLRSQHTVHAHHKLCILPGDGIGPEIMAVATNMLEEAGKKTGDTFEMEEHLIGGAAIEEHDDPYPAVTEEACKRSDSVLLAAIGGCALYTIRILRVTLHTAKRCGLHMHFITAVV